MPNSDLVNSVVKALDILQFVSDRPEGVRLGEIVDAFGLKRPTAYNLVRTLRARHYLEQDAARKLRLGSAPGELLAGQRRGSLLAAAERELPRLSGCFPDAVLTFCELSGCEIFCRLRMSPDPTGHIQSPLSFLFPPYSTVTGLCFQAFGEFDAAGFERKYPFREFGSPLWGSLEAFRRMLDDCRRAGHAERREGDSELYAAIPCGGRFSLGFHGSIPAGRTAEQLLGELKTAAERLQEGVSGI